MDSKSPPECGHPAAYPDEQDNWRCVSCGVRIDLETWGDTPDPAPPALGEMEPK